VGNGSERFLGRGWRFPIRASQGTHALLEGEEKVRQSIWLVLATAPGERRMLPDFGCGIHDLVFQANTAALRGRVRENVVEALARYEPRIDVVEVQVESQPEEPNRLDIRVDYRLRTNNAFFNLVYPFYLTEGVR
jgi:phage baseplate assembly protein W